MLILVKDFPTFGDLGNCNLTWESPQISTRWSQTPDEGIGTLSAKCATQEVFDDSHLSGNIEGSQTCVERIIVYIVLLKAYKVAMQILSLH